MVRLRTSAAVACIALVMPVLSAPHALANPADSTWSMSSGGLTAPARSASAATVTLVGNVTVGQGVIDSAGCTDPSAAAQAHLSLVNVSTSVVTALSGSGLVVSAAGTTAVSGTASVSPGTYAAVIRVRCGDAGSWGAATEASPQVRATIASLVSTEPITRACRPTTPETPCTSASQQVSSVPSGLTAVFSGVVRQTWSDAVTTDVAPTGTQRLEAAPATGGSWTTVNSGTCAATLTISSNRQYRCISGSGTHAAVTVSVMSNTSTVTLGTPTVTPTSALRGDTISMSVPVLMVYGDGSSWPAPTDVQYRVEHLAAGLDRWVQIAGPLSLETRGAISRGIAHPGAGKLRWIVGTTVSATVDITEATAGSTYTWSNVSFPATVNTRGTLTASARVQQGWSDGVQRNPVDGTRIEIQQAVAYSTLDSDLTWRTVATTSVSGGNVNVRLNPLTSGFWRLKIDETVSPVSFVQLTGSTPLNFAAAISLVAEEKPFAGKTSRYDITSSLTGYAGGSSLYLWVTIGTTEYQVGSYYSNTTLSGAHSITAPTAPGTYIPTFQLRDPSGFVLASLSGTAIVVDGYVTVAPVPTLPLNAPLAGDEATITVRLVATTLAGVSEDLDWSGPVELQKLQGDSWVTVDSETWTSGKTVSLSFTAEVGIQLRIYVQERNLTGPVFLPEIAGPTGRMLFTEVTSSTRLISGVQTTASTSFVEVYTNGAARPITSTTWVMLQRKVNGEWVDFLQYLTSDGAVSATYSLTETSTLRFYVPSGQGSASEEWTTTVITRGPVNASWSTTVRPGRGHLVSFTLKASDGGSWPRTETVQVQHQAPESLRWRTVASVELRPGRSGDALVPTPQAGSYRAVLATTGETYDLDIPRPTGAYALRDVKMSTARAQEGVSVTVSGTLLRSYTDGRDYPFVGRDYLGLNGVAGDDVYTEGYRITRAAFNLRFVAFRDMTYRIVLPDGSTSEPLVLNVVYPVMKVEWPQQVDVKVGLVVKASLRANDGAAWSGTALAQLQHRASSSARWITRARVNLRNGNVAQMIARDPKPGEFRVIVPRYGLEEKVRASFASSSATAGSRVRMDTLLETD